jgi:hypothetical protein
VAAGAQGRPFVRHPRERRPVPACRIPQTSPASRPDNPEFASRVP